MKALIRVNVRGRQGREQICRPSSGTYNAGSGSAKPENAGYVVRFKDGKVRIVGYVATPAQIITPSLQGFTIGTVYDKVVEKLGQPDHVSTSLDGLQRMVSSCRPCSVASLDRCINA